MRRVIQGCLAAAAAVLVAGACGSDEDEQSACVQNQKGCFCGYWGEEGDPVDRCTASMVTGDAYCQVDPERTTCECVPYRCAPQSFGCSCGPDPSATGTSCTDPAHVCCVKRIPPSGILYCACLDWTDTCDADSVPVSTCNLADAWQSAASEPGLLVDVCP